MIVVPVYNMILTPNATVFFQVDQLRRNSGGSGVAVNERVILAPLKESGSICRPLAPGDLQEKQPKKKQQTGGPAGGSQLSRTLADALKRKDDYSAMAAAAKQLSEQLSNNADGNAEELKDVGEFVMAFGLCVANKIKH